MVSVVNTAVSTPRAFSHHGQGSGAGWGLGGAPNIVAPPFPHSSHRYTRRSGVEESPSWSFLSQRPLNPRGGRIRAALGMVPWFCRSLPGPAMSQGPALPGTHRGDFSWRQWLLPEGLWVWKKAGHRGWASGSRTLSSGLPGQRSARAFHWAATPQLGGGMGGSRCSPQERQWSLDPPPHPPTARPVHFPFSALWSICVTRACRARVEAAEAGTGGGPRGLTGRTAAWRLV